MLVSRASRGLLGALCVCLAVFLSAGAVHGLTADRTPGALPWKNAKEQDRIALGSFRAPSAPECEVGAYLTDLYDVHPESNEFSVRVWMWSLCSTKEADPLATATFPQGYSPWKSEPEHTKVKDGYYTLIGFDGKFRHYFDRRNFPFDEHLLDVTVAAAKNEKTFRMVPDKEKGQIGFSPEINTPRWDIKDFSVTTETRNYATDFGDRSNSTGASSNFSEAVLHIKVASSDTKIFWELAGPIFIVFLITLLTFLLTSAETSAFAGRITALGASMFAVLVNWGKLSGLMPATAGFSMLGKLHLLTMAYVLVGIGITVLCWRWSAQERKKEKVKRLNHLGIAIGVVFYVGIAIWLVVGAATVPAT
ncbi:hypothetical protein SSP35_40_00070 [Streptomyces sp. NBRC 110611]|uniref:hypothetical protein n=1 Tax=Streptomyces sp. NBRC 110611 TaxID=1621259 RepID=UPI00083775C6|nr:hypothetical protein [Streptomyces sp. NBRC 110611]GAU71441.1 hypothetical protein SSP35_40_00070 [Streptomyces sp. NBRC 110611]